MIRRSIPAALLISISLTCASFAQVAPYEEKILRLSEIMGSLHYLRNICGEKSNVWRSRMQELLEAESPEGDRRKLFIASFNRGYRAYATSHTFCSAASIEAIDRYMKEGEVLSRDIVVRFGS